jgi:hypothetical protein
LPTLAPVNVHADRNPIRYFDVVLAATGARRRELRKASIESISALVDRRFLQL